MNFTSRNAVFTVAARLRLQPMNSHSEKRKPGKLHSVKSHPVNTQCSYSPGDIPVSLKRIFPNRLFVSMTSSTIFFNSISTLGPSSRVQLWLDFFLLKFLFFQTCNL